MSSILYVDFSNIDINSVFVIKSDSQKCCIVELILIYHFLMWWIWRGFDFSRTHYWVSFYSSWPRCCKIIAHSTCSYQQLSCWTLSLAVYYLCTLWYIFFQWKITHFLNVVCHWSQSDKLSTCFMECFYFCMVWISNHQHFLHQLSSLLII